MEECEGYKTADYQSLNGLSLTPDSNKSTFQPPDVMYFWKIKADWGSFLVSPFCYTITHRPISGYQQLWRPPTKTQRKQLYFPHHTVKLSQSLLPHHFVSLKTGKYKCSRSKSTVADVSLLWLMLACSSIQELFQILQVIQIVTFNLTF